MVHEVSTSMYEVQTKDCGLGKAKVYSEIRIFEDVECKDGKVIVPLEEKLDLTVCDSGGNPYGIEVDVSGNFGFVTKNNNQFDKDHPDLIYVGGSASKTDYIKADNQFLIGESITSAVTNTIYLKTYLDCSDYIKPSEIGSDDAKSKIISCISGKYRTNVQWKLITFQKDQTQDKIYYTFNGELDEKGKSQNVPRQININIRFNEASCGTSSSTSGSSQTQQEQYVKVELKCNDENNKFEVAKKIVGYSYYNFAGSLRIETISNALTILSQLCQTDNNCKDDGTCYLILNTKDKKIEAIQ